MNLIMGGAFRVAMWLTTGQSRQRWVAVHRKHHTFTDREGDPHTGLMVIVGPPVARTHATAQRRTP